MILFVVILQLICLVLLVCVYRSVRHNYSNECPACHKTSLRVVQQCKSCNFIRSIDPVLSEHGPHPPRR